jgi:hypothetical protein
MDDLLVANLSEKAAKEIARVVNSEISTYAKRASQFSSAETRARLGLTSYTLRVLGTNRREATGRSRLKSIRHILSQRFGFSNVETDYESTSDVQVVIHFDAKSTLVPDDIIDAFYEEFGAFQTFQANYFGGNDYEVSF